jgi:hypothetical protein
MFKKLLLTFFLLFSSFIIIYPSKKETTNLLDYCYSFEKLLARNSLEDNKESNKFNSFAKDVTFFGTNKTKGALVNKVIDQYKTSKKLFIINLVPNKFICLTGYWIEVVNPGLFKSMIYQKSKQKINQYKDIKKEVDEFIKDINLETIKKEMKDLFKKN